MTGIILCMTIAAGGAWRAAPVYAEEPKAVRLERTVGTTETEVGERFIVNYRIFGDEIKVDRAANEVAVIIDTSGSMNWSLGGSSRVPESQKRITIAKKGAKNFINSFNNTNTKIFIVPFDSQVRGISTFEDMLNPESTSRLNSYIDNLFANGGTNLGDSLRIAYRKLDEEGNPEAKKHIVVLTDGDPTFFTYTGQINRSSFAYYKEDGLAGSVYGVKTNTSNDYSRGFEYASIMGEFMKNQRTGSGQKKFNFHIIGFADNSSNLDIKLDEIGETCGADTVPTNSGKHYYKALTENDLEEAYNAIWGKIANAIPFGTLHFAELLPADVILAPEAEVMLAEDYGFEIIKIQAGGEDRIQITGDLAGSMNYKRSEPDGDIYQLMEQELSFEINVIAQKAGDKIFEKGVTTIDYVYFLPDSPDNSISGKASNENEISVKINLRDSRIEMAGSLTVLEGCTADLGVDVTVGDPEDITVDTWSSPDGGTIINVVEKGGHTAGVSGLKAGRTTIEATTKSAKEWYKTAAAQCTVNVIGIEARNIYLLNGSTGPELIPIEKYIDIEVPEGVNFSKSDIGIENITFGGDEIIDGGLKTDKDGFVQIDALNNMRGLKPTGNSFVTIKADLKYGEQARTIEWRAYVIDAEISPAEKLNIEIWSTGRFDISYNLPDALEGTEIDRIASDRMILEWSLSGPGIGIKSEDAGENGRIGKITVKGTQLTGDEGVEIEIKVKYADSLAGVPVQEKSTSCKVIVGKSLIDVQ